MGSLDKLSRIFRPFLPPLTKGAGGDFWAFRCPAGATFPAQSPGKRLDSYNLKSKNFLQTLDIGLSFISNLSLNLSLNLNLAFLKFILKHGPGSC